MQWFFGQRYNNVTTRTVRPCGVDEARLRHQHGEEYAAVLRDPEAQRTLAGLELATSARSANVSFLDGAGRLHLRYVFGPAERGERMFLQRAHVLEYADDGTKQSSASETYFFSEDRSVRSEREDKVAGTHTTREGTEDTLDRHYEPVPVFGDYASLLRIDRDRRVEEQAEDSPSWPAGETPAG